MNKPFRFGLVPLALACAGLARGDDAAAAPKPDELTTLRSDNKQLSDELAASWKETASLKADLAAAQAAAAKSADASADLQKQLDTAKAQAAAPTPASPDTGASGQASELQDKLDTALRSFTVVQDENTKLKDSLDKEQAQNAALNQQLDAARASMSALQGQAAAAAEIEPLRAQVRQAQDESSQLAAENSQLRNRLALQGQNPGSSAPVPLRPGAAPALAPSAPTQGAAQTSAPGAAPRTYTVVEGDTLTRISRKFYGTSSRWQDILKANRDVLKNEKSLVVGSTLKIP